MLGYSADTGKPNQYYRSNQINDYFLLSLAILVIFQWMAIVGAKGASTDLALSMKILRNLALLCLFIADFICPPLAYVMIPAGGTNGLNNAKVSAFQYVVNAIVGISVSVGAAVYAFRIWNVMGG